jgi:hypothetical protein
MSLAAAGPRPSYRAAFASAKMCYASFCLAWPSPATEPKEARPLGLISNFSSNILSVLNLMFRISSL